ncbi:FkbM family methyltransferase [Planctomycetota bacterium]
MESRIDLTYYIKKLGRKIRPSEHKIWSRKWRDEVGDNRLRFDYPLTSQSLVLDLGGYQGQWASDLYARYRCKMKIFEPVATFSAAIDERFCVNDDIEVYPYGLGASSRAETIHLSADGSSIFRKSGETETIQIVDIRQWFQEHNVSQVQLMKINIEGGEYELLERMIECELMDRIDNIQVQFHELSSASKKRMEAIQQELRRTHCLTYQYIFVWENWTRRG